MHFFDNVSEDLFRPLIGTNKRRYMGCTEFTLG